MAGLYVHVPFCVKRCIYCDFYSTVRLEDIEAYISALLLEMEIRRDEWRDEVFDTIYFGGGTPSQLQAQELERIIDGIRSSFTVANHPEITLEANPDDLDDRYVSSLQMLPVNRISMGVQSFDDSELRLLNRRHTAQEAIDAVIRCKKAGLTNISIDLMYGLPNQTMEQWVATIDKAIKLDISHLSAYNLTYEEGTSISQMLKSKEINPVEDDLCEQFFRILIEKLTNAGFIHYEISNFARCSPLYPDGRISHHNTSYWIGAPYLGLGPAAHSYNGVNRSWNVSSLSGYIKAIGDNSGTFYETEVLDERTRYNDFILTRLRTMWGVSLDELRREFGKERENAFLIQSEPFISIKKLKREGDNVKVLPEGIFVSDAIIRELIVL